MIGPALGLIELASMTRAYVVLDALSKRAEVTIHAHRELTPGKTLILFAGGEENCLEAHQAGLAASATHLIDDLLLPQAHAQLLRALQGHLAHRQGGSAAVIEFNSVAATLLAVDRALKTTPVQLIKMRLAVGIGGRGLCVLCGPLDEIEAAAEAACQVVHPSSLCGCEVIAQPLEEIWSHFTQAPSDPLL